MRIKIIPNGPYVVMGNVPIRAVTINSDGVKNWLDPGPAMPQGETYHLCRCGQTKTPPFCDGTHDVIHFDGQETAAKDAYVKRIKDVAKGGTMQLLDDGRCAYARFCHTENGTIWAMTENDSDPRSRKNAIEAAHNCPSGRLSMFDLHGNSLDQEFSPEILIVTDPAKHSHAGIWVRGPIAIEAADGTEYEVRNRVALCRCGAAKKKPFCDASHVNAPNAQL